MTLSHSGAPATNARIREAHSKIPLAWLGADDLTHPIYKQGHDEECFICTLLNRVEELEAAFARPVGRASTIRVPQ